jgi:hypothetical protein
MADAYVFYSVALNYLCMAFFICCETLGYVHGSSDKEPVVRVMGLNRVAVIPLRTREANFDRTTAYLY